MMWAQTVLSLNPLWDLAFAMEYSAQKAERISMEDWWEANWHVAVVLTLHGTIDRIVNFRGPKILAYDETETAVANCKLAARLFSAQLSDMRLEKVSLRIKDLVDVARKQDVTAATYRSLKARRA